MPRRILIQLDGDAQPSTFDAVVAVDAGADVLLRHGGVTADSVVPLVHGALFTRGGADLAATAIFVGGSDVAAAASVARRVADTFFGPFRVGVLVDPSGANTTAAAAVVVAMRHLTAGREPLQAVVLAGTGPVGQRVARLLVRKRMRVTLGSRSLSRAEATAATVRKQVPDAQVSAIESFGTVRSGSPLAGVLAAADLVVAAGASGATLLDDAGRAAASRARVLIDLNAVPPAGIHGIVAGDKARAEGGSVVYGALGVGGTKMKIHRAAIE
ncbi:MAG: bifunctional NADP-dependent methylenetetrahydromethanopterin dehydrogenase/methylenetetrahydrofolate dehydrogenase, partial [Planctomycetes bacterium]|nr:bifunctional NADP-dependent methylenetetrahydromethanopterin dehydrogenase/methylenetetrahydrofolate dehydrogenase [Planctomycetota bacterium]